MTTTKPIAVLAFTVRICSSACAAALDREADIVAAVNAATEGEEIVIADGTYRFESTMTVAKGVTVRGEHGRSKTIITSPVSPVQVFSVTGGRIEGFTFTNFTMTTASVVSIKASGATMGQVVGWSSPLRKAGQQHYLVWASSDRDVGGNVREVFDKSTSDWFIDIGCFQLPLSAPGFQVIFR